jgi:four helix bundle protein
VRGRAAVVVTAPALVGAWRVRATPEEIVMFHAQTIAHEFVAAVRPVIAAVKPQDQHLADQLKRAATSASLNLAEGNRRAGRDRVARFRIASAECGEAVDALRLAVAFGHVADDAIADALGLGDRLSAMLWRLTHPRP